MLRDWIARTPFPERHPILPVNYAEPDILFDQETRERLDGLMPRRVGKRSARKTDNRTLVTRGQVRRAVHRMERAIRKLDADTAALVREVLNQIGGVR